MPTKQEIYRKVHGFVTLATGLSNDSVRPTYVNGPMHIAQDRDELCTINIINQIPIGQDSMQYANRITPIRITVAGADEAGFNEEYVYNGLVNAKPSWLIGTYSCSWAAGTWTLSNGLEGEDALSYTAAGTDWLPPLTSWEGGAIAPTLSYYLDLDETVYGDRNITASIKIYGNTADDICEKILLALTSSSGLSYLNQNGLGFLRNGSILDISTLANGSFENRRMLDVEFHVVSTGTNVVNAIESAKLYWGYSEGGEIDTETGTIEVTL